MSKLNSAIDLAVYIPMSIVMLCSMAFCCSGAEPLNLSILADTKPIAKQACEPLDLRILTEPIAAAPTEHLDLTILSGVEVKPVKPAVRPSAKLMVQPELGKEIGHQCKPMAAIDFIYPQRANHWTHPGSIRQHVMSGQHAGKLAPDQVAAMTDAELEAWHSDDHEGKATLPTKIEKLIALVTAKPKRRTMVDHEGTWYERSDGKFSLKKEEGVEYEPPFNAPRSTIYQAPSPQPERYSSVCPGGKCPTIRPRRR